MLANSEERARWLYRIVMRRADTQEILKSEVMPLYAAEQILGYVNVVQTWDGIRIDRARLVPVVPGIAREQ